MPPRRGNAATRQALADGDSYVIVFDDTALLDNLKGDSVEYVLEFEH
jgi:hypothetical protein